MHCQWSVGFVTDNNELTSTDYYKQRLLKQLTEVRRKWKEQQQTKPTQDNFSIEERVLQPDNQDHLLVAQQNIWSLQERLLELESQEDRQHMATKLFLNVGSYIVK